MKHTPDYEALAQNAVNNWKRFDSFGLSDSQHHEGRTIVYTLNRGSKLLDRTNAETIADTLKRFPTVEEFSANHWACGWVSGYSIQVYTKAGKVTAGFKAWCDLSARLEDYPVLDDDAYSDAQYEEACKIMENEGWDDNDENFTKAVEWA